MAARRFEWPDYVVVGAALLGSAGVGLFYGCSGGRQRSTAEFLLADRRMGVLPTTLSLLASFMSAITLLGTPAEIYLYGTVYWWIWLGYLLMIPLAAHLFLPVFFRLGVTSVYEYLALRYRSVAVRRAGALTFCLQMLLYMAIVLYAPALALQQVSGLSVWVSVALVGAVCTFYTALGGMKAVMWTDSLQVCLMFAGLLAVLIQGSISHGGFSRIWQDNVAGGRIQFEDWDLSPLRRHTFWTCTVGGCFTWLAVYGTNQAQVQRALTVPRLGQAQLALWLNVPLLTALLTICALAGLVIYAQYKDCDPLTTGQAGAADQLLPLYVMEHLSLAPGLPGLAVACLFSGALSTISSGLNSLAAVILQDLIMTTQRFKDLKDNTAATLSKVLALASGAVCMALTVVAAQLGSVLQAALALFGMIGGPLLGLFFLGILFPCANWIGALAGLFCGLAVTFWVGVGAQIYKHPSIQLPRSTVGCLNVTNAVNCTAEDCNDPFAKMVDELEGLLNFTEPKVTAVTTNVMDDFQGDLDIYALSYLHYGTLAVVTVCVVGVCVSLCTGSQQYADADPKHLNPPGDVFCCCCPEHSRSWMRCMVPQYTEQDLDLYPDNMPAEKSDCPWVGSVPAHGISNPAYDTFNNAASTTQL